MTGTLTYIDYLASSSRSVWHRASALAKIAMLAALIAAVITVGSWRAVAGLLGLALLLAATARVPARVAAAVCAYPLLFSILYALSHPGAGWVAGLTWTMRGVTGALGALWLVATTPFPDLFAPASRVLPRPIGDGLFLTYRAFFALVTRAEQLWRALRLRGFAAFGARPMRASAVVGEGLGTLVLHSFERSERLYGAMRLRGHSGRICGCRHYAEWTWVDLLPLALAALLVAFAVLARGPR